MQTQLPFNEIIDVLDKLKQKRKDGLEKTGAFSSDEINFLLKITYDLTDKDFEYFVAYILEKEGFKNVKVQGGFGDEGADIIAEKNGKKLFIQCKQWANPYVSLTKAGEFYGSIYKLKKTNPSVNIAYVTTSYVPPETEQFLRECGIEGVISNGRLTKRAQELGLFNQEGWSELIQYIRNARLNKIRNELQTSLPIGYNELKKLKKERIYEISNHLPKNMQKRYIDFTSISNKNIGFFQYWNF